MERIEEWVEQKLPKSKLFEQYFGGLRTAVLDIETAGLSPADAKVILCGVLLEDGAGLSVRQFFAERLGQEAALLEASAELLQNVDLLITFNGKRFDLPFLLERAERQDVPFPTQFYHLDLYQIFHRFSPFREFLPDLKQKTLERFAGLSEERRDEIDGRESVALYESFLLSGEEGLRSRILLHNRDDVVQLGQLICLLGKIDLHRAMYCCGFPIPSAGGLRIVDEIRLEDAQLSARIRSADGSEEDRLRFPLEQELGYAFLDLRRYPHLLAEMGQSPACHSDYLLLCEQNGSVIYHDVVNRLLRGCIAR